MAIDRRILVSLHGNRLGLTRGAHLVEDDHVMEPSWRDRGSRVILMDHFTGPVLSTVQWSVNKGSDGGAANFAFNAAKGGTVRATTGAGAGANEATNAVQITGSLNWQADQGGLEFGTSVKMAAITTIHTFVGFTNQVAALQTPGTISGGTLTVVANDFVGFMFDTAATVATWKFVSAIGGVANPIIDLGVAPTAAAYDMFQMDIDVAGNAIGRMFSGTSSTEIVVQQALALTPTVPLAPLVNCFRRAASSTTIDVDFISCQVDRSAA